MATRSLKQVISRSRIQDVQYQAALGWLGAVTVGEGLPGAMAVVLPAASTGSGHLGLCLFWWEAKIIGRMTSLQSGLTCCGSCLALLPSNSVGSPCCYNFSALPGDGCWCSWGCGRAGVGSVTLNQIACGCPCIVTAYCPLWTQPLLSHLRIFPRYWPGSPEGMTAFWDTRIWRWKEAETVLGALLTERLIPQCCSFLSWFSRCSQAAAKNPSIGP